MSKITIFDGCGVVFTILGLWEKDNARKCAISWKGSTQGAKTPGNGDGDKIRNAHLSE